MKAKVSIFPVNRWAVAMRTKKEAKISAPRRLVTRVAPVTGRQYQEIRKQLKMEVGHYLNRLGGTMRDHYIATNEPDAPLNDVTLCLHLRLLDRYPQMVEPEPTIDELLIKIRAILRENPNVKLPMRLSSTFLALILGRNPRTASMWNMGKAEPAGKVTQLIKDLMLILDTHPDPAAFIQEYVDMVLIEAGARGLHDLFTLKRWPTTYQRNQARETQDGELAENFGDEEGADFEEEEGDVGNEVGDEPNEARSRQAALPLSSGSPGKSTRRADKTQPAPSSQTLKPPKPRAAPDPKR